MAQPSKRRAELVVVGSSHRSGTLALRDRLFIEEAAQSEALAGLKAAGFEQALVLSTCDRTEVHATDAEPAVAVERIAAFLAARAGAAPAALSSQIYRLTDKAALRHIFAVAASLDSQVIGEPQVLGQLKASHRIAREAGMVGGDLGAALQGAYRTAKRVRTETALAQQPVSIAAAAVQLARKVHGDLGRCSGLLIGTGEMGELLADQLGKAGLARLTVAHRSQRRAELTARRLACHFLALDRVPAGLEAADIVIGALGAGESVVTLPMIRAALKMRRRRPILLLDVAVPSDIEMAVGQIEEAFLYDLDDLEQLAMRGRSTRAAAAKEAWGIVDQEVAAFLRKQSGRVGVPPLIALRRHFEALRAEVLETARPGDAEEATRLLVNKLLHDPAEMLRAMASAEPMSGPAEPETAAQALRAIFGLAETVCDEGADDPADADRRRQKEDE